MKHLFLLVALGLCLWAQPKSSLKIDIEPKAALKADVDVPFQVTVKDAKGAPVSGAQVEVVATMVEMDHGEFKSDAKESKPGVYQTSQKFMMGGAWNLKVQAKKGSDAGTLNKKVDVQD